MTNAAIATLAQRVLDTHHAYIRAHLPPLEAELVAARASPELLRPLAALRYLLEEHVMKEEHILFPRFLALRELEEGAALGVEAPIRGMWQEHDQLRDLEHQLRQVLPEAGAHQAELVAFLDDLAEHARVEDEELFAAVLEREGTAPTEQRPRPWAPPRPARRPVPPPPPPSGLRARLREWLGWE